jgi:uncharacterized protein (DUF1778 family)
MTKTTHATRRPITLQATPEQAEAWAAAATAAGMSRHAFLVLVCEVATGRADVSALQRVKPT